MHIEKEFNHSEVVFDSFLNKQPFVSLILNNDEVLLNFNDIINTQFTEGNIGAKLTHLKKFLNLGMYSKAPCGGFLNFFELLSKNGNSLIVFSGVNEVSNSHYIITIHKIISCLDSLR
jgi:hypothetical protein